MQLASLHVGEIMSWFILVLGFSYLLQAPLWIRLARLAIREPEKLFPMYLLLLLAGLLVIHTHNTWVLDWPLLVTVIGWLMAIKGGLMLLLPGTAAKLSDWSDASMISMVRIYGVIFVMLATLMIYHGA